MKSKFALLTGVGIGWLLHTERKRLRDLAERMGIHVDVHTRKIGSLDELTDEEAEQLAALLTNFDVSVDQVSDEDLQAINNAIQAKSDEVRDAVKSGNAKLRIKLQKELSELLRIQERAYSLRPDKTDEDNDLAENLAAAQRAGWLQRAMEKLTEAERKVFFQGSLEDIDDLHDTFGKEQYGVDNSSRFTDEEFMELIDFVNEVRRERAEELQEANLNRDTQD